MVDTAADNREKSRTQVAAVLGQLQKDIGERIERLLDSRRFRHSPTSSVNTIDSLIAASHNAQSVEQFLSHVADTLRAVADLSGITVTAKASLDAAACAVSVHTGFTDVEDGDFHLQLDNPLIKAAQESEAPLRVRDLEGIVGPRSRQRAMLRRIECDAIMGLRAGSEPLGLVLLQFADDAPATDSNRLTALQPYASIIGLALHNRLLREQLT